MVNATESASVHRPLDFKALAVTRKSVVRSV